MTGCHNNSVQSKDFIDLILKIECQEYKELACNISYVGNTPNSIQIGSKLSNCASTTLPVILGGEAAKRREYPHMVYVLLSTISMIDYSTYIRHWSGGRIMETRHISAAVAP